MNDFPFDIVCFDLDGTLLETHRDLGTAVNHALTLGGFATVPIDNAKDLIGGGAKNPLWRQIVADMMATPVVCTMHSEAGALGAAIQAAWCHARQTDTRGGGNSGSGSYDCSG